MDKPIRKAVRTFIIQNGEVLAIKYLTEKNNGFYAENYWKSDRNVI